MIDDRPHSDLADSCMEVRILPCALVLVSVVRVVLTRVLVYLNSLNLDIGIRLSRIVHRHSSFRWKMG